MRAGLPFLAGHVLGALVIGAFGGALVNGASILSFAIVMGMAALASGLLCNWLPGYDGPGWMLWLSGAGLNPLLLVALASSFDTAGCVVGTQTGRACMFSDIGEMIVGVCLLPPLIGLGVRWLMRPRPTPQPPD
jgi:hypothetical protein